MTSSIIFDILLIMEITFHEIVKMIHPDTHPDIKDASVKMSLCVKYKRDNLALWNLAIKWGLVKGEYNISAPEAVIPPRPSVPAQPSPYDEWTRGFTRQRTTPPRPRPEIRVPRGNTNGRVRRSAIREFVNSLFTDTTTQVHTGWDVNNFPRRDKSWTL